MYNVTAYNLRDGYVDIARRVLRQGAPASPRDQATVEIDGGFHLELIDPRDALPTGVGRKVPLALAAAEALFLIGGVCDPDLLERIAPMYKNFRQDDGSLHGAYGPRTRLSFARAQRLLQRDPDTRQAVVTIFDSGVDLDRPEIRDVPCTVMLHFLRRQDALDLHVTMRSNDVFLGLALDAFVFCQVQITMARCIGVRVGRYFHNATSLHAYERDRSRIEALTWPRDQDGVTPQDGIGGRIEGEPWEWYAMRARGILEGAATMLTPTEAWMHESLEKYR